MLTSYQGASFAISINLFFAGLLSMFYPRSVVLPYPSLSHHLFPTSLPSTLAIHPTKQASRKKRKKQTDCGLPTHSINNGLGDGGSLGLFSGLNLVAFVLVFLLLEETKQMSLEDLDLVFAVRKRIFMRFQVTEYLPWFLRRYVLGRRDLEKPRLYNEYVWGPERKLGVPSGGDGGDMLRAGHVMSQRTIDTAHE